METVIQIILTVSVVSLTAIFVTVGIWVISILKEFKGLVSQLKAVSDDLKETTSFAKGKIKESLSLATVLAAIGALWSQREKMGGILFGRKEKDEIKPQEKTGRKKKATTKKREKSENEVKEKKEEKASTVKPQRRFFFRRKK